MRASLQAGATLPAARDFPRSRGREFAPSDFLTKNSSEPKNSIDKPMIISQAELDSFTNVVQSHPHDFLGIHHASCGNTHGIVVRAYLDDAKSVSVKNKKTGKITPMERLSKDGFFEAWFPRARVIFHYTLIVESYSGATREIADAYSFWQTISDSDLYLINQGTDHRVYEKLGSHVREIDGVKGVSFAVWAPSARRVSVVGDFNGWDGRYHAMRMLGASGIWEIFIPGVAVGAKYKFELLNQYDPTPYCKIDPYAISFEPPPNNACIVADISGFKWNDAAWLEKRDATNWQEKPVSVYEMHLDSWKRVPEEGDRPLTYRELGDELAKYCTEMGFTHVEMLPPTEYPFPPSWGYQVTGFYAPTCRFGSPEDFMVMVDKLHACGIGVIIDWVPAHFPRDDWGLAGYDGTHLYDHADPRQGTQPDWGTLLFNFGRCEVRGFMTGSALSWLGRFHVDGLRVDAVAAMLYLDYSRKDGEWIPNRYGGKENIESIEFLRATNDLVHHYHPGAITIAEESTSFAGVTHPTRDNGLGFDFKWAMGWMHDTLAYMKEDPLNRKFHHNKLTFAMLYQYSEKFMLALSHDEVVHGKASLINKMPFGDMPTKAANLRALFGYMWTWPGKKTLFMGGEFGQSHEWKYDGSLDWHLLEYIDHEGVRRAVRDLNKLYRSRPEIAALDQDYRGFEWINANDGDNSVLSYLRKSPDGKTTWLVVCNFTPVARTYRVGVPEAGRWGEVFNSDAEYYGGSGMGNFGGKDAEPKPWNDRANSLEIALPGLSTLIFELRK
ncbi:MAG: 1,4-alpha-glucan branching protein GlgB [Opitutae bacterium]|nr:1,4-alpha-glucan branching protein GlgB [Opitutae bacterium]